MWLRRELPKLQYVVASRLLLRPLASAQLANTQSRPFGVALLIAGFDEKGPQLYHTDPSGTFVRYDAKAIGSGSDAAQQALQDAFHKAITLDEAKTLALKVLKQVMEEKLDENNVQLAQVRLASDSLRCKDNLRDRADNQVTKEKGFEILNEVDLKAVIDTVAA